MKDSTYSIKSNLKALEKIYEYYDWDSLKPMTKEELSKYFPKGVCECGAEKNK